MHWAQRLMGLLCLAGTVVLGGNPVRDDVSERVTQLVEQLGHPRYAMREAAARELDAIGEPALAALRKASDDADPEIRQRAEQIADGIVGRMRAEVTRTALGELQGAWSLVSYDANGNRVKGEDESHLFRFDGDQWSIQVDGRLFQAGTVQIIEKKGNLNTIDLLIKYGGAGEETARSIYQVEGDTLRYLFSGGPRATEFGTRPGDGRHYSVFRRARPGAARLHEAARLPKAQFESFLFATDLPVPQCEASVLTLSPTEPKYDAFENPSAESMPSPVVTLDCTLSLGKADKGRRLYDIRGHGIASHYALVVYEGGMLWEDSRLLLHGQGGGVRRVNDLIRPEPLLPRAIRAAFQPITQIRVPVGRKPIESVRKGDLITSLDTDVQSSRVRVACVIVTGNRLMEVKTAVKDLTTTATQPLALTGGGFRPTSELKAGDRTWLLIGGERRAAIAQEVTPTDCETHVFKLILGRPIGFVVDDFLVRSKTPDTPLP